MDSKNYVEWCELAGLYLKNISHYDRYRTYGKELSPEGVNTIIVSDFLSDISPDLNVGDWRTYNVYELGNNQKQRIERTAKALEAIGAARIADAVRSAESHSPLEALYDLDPSDPQAVQKAFEGLNAPGMLHHLRESLAHMVPEVAEKAGLTSASNNAPSSQRSPAYESRQEIEQLLEQYAAANADKLAADIKKHGDPREKPGFTREKRLAELEFEQERLFSQEEQREDLDKLKDIMVRIEKSKAAGKGLSQKKQNSTRRQFLKLIKQNRRIEPQILLPEMQSLLAEAEEFMRRHPDVFDRQATGDKQLQARLSAIGEYEIDADAEEVQLHWEQPAGLSCEWGLFELTLIFPQSKNKQDKALAALLDAFDRVQKRFPQLSADWRSQLIESFRNHQAFLSDWELEDYELNEEDEPTEASILEHCGTGVIVFHVYDDEEGILAETVFSIDWDQEHGFEIEWEIPEDGTAAEGEAFQTGDVRMTESGAKVTDADIAAFEKQFDLQLPAAYRQFLLLHNGGKPEPNHIILRMHGEKMPFDVDRFFSLLADDSKSSLAGQLRSARGKSLPESLLPIAATADSAMAGQKAHLCLVLTGKRKDRIVLVETDSLMLHVPVIEGQIEPTMLARIIEDVIGQFPTVAKNLNELFGKFQERPAVAVPDWLAFIRNNDIPAFLGWLEAGGKLKEEFADYGEPFPRKARNYLAQEASVELLREVLNRRKLKPADIRDNWLRFGRADTARFRELMPLLPKKHWPTVLISPEVWNEPDLLEELAEAKVDFDAPIDEEGRTALHYAVEAGCKEAVQWLMNHGADPHRKDKYDRDAFIWAEDGPGFECLPILEGQSENAESAGTASPDGPGIAVLQEAADQLPEGVSLTVEIEIKSPPVTRIEKSYYSECHYRLSIDIRRGQVTFKDVATPRQDYLRAGDWPGVLFAPILQWPDLLPIWDTLEVRELDWQKALRKRNYESPLREDLLEAARSALEQAFDPNEAASRGIRLRKS